MNESKHALRGSYALRYIKWGEANGWHKGATCDARVTEERHWYDLTGHPRGKMFWPKSQQYKHAAPSNDERLQANCNLYDVTPHEGVDTAAMAGILNSSWAVLAKFQYGRPVGNEGNLKTEVVDVTMMPVPDPRDRPARVLTRVATAFARLKRRDAQQFLPEHRMRQMALNKAGKDAQLEKLSALCELDMEDRRELDDAVLEMLGVLSQPERNALIDHLYAYLREFFEHVRQKEEKAIANKDKSKRRSTLSPTEIAAQVVAEIKDKFGHLLRPYSAFVNLDRPFSTYDLPADGIAEVHQDMFAARGSVRFVKGRKVLAIVPTKAPEHADLIALIAANGIRGLVRVPLEGKDSATLKETYERFLEGRQQRIRHLVEERTGDPDLQEEICGAVHGLILHET